MYQLSLRQPARGQIEDYIRRYFDGQKELAGKLIFELKIHDSQVWENSKSLARLAGAPYSVVHEKA